MIKKIILISFAIIFLVGIVYVLIERYSTHTFEEVTDELLKENETIDEIVLTNYSLESEHYRKSFSLNEATYSNILKSGADMKLQQRDHVPPIDYWITIKTDTRNLDILVHEEKIRVEDQTFKVVGDNPLVEYLDTFNWDE